MVENQDVVGRGNHGKGTRTCRKGPLQTMKARSGGLTLSASPHVPPPTPPKAPVFGIAEVTGSSRIERLVTLHWKQEWK